MKKQIATAQKAKPILFSTEMVLALKEGRKCMTRRVILPQPPSSAGTVYRGMSLNSASAGKAMFESIDERVYAKPKYLPGDTVWVQEAWRIVSMCPELLTMDICFKADGETVQDIQFTSERFAKFEKYARKNGWQSPYFMPKEAVRLEYRIKAVRAERVQDISEADARAEGMDAPSYPIAQFHSLWDNLNGERDDGEYQWAANPWVWVYSFGKCHGLS